jgi:hypothetical protein
MAVSSYIRQLSKISSCSRLSTRSLTTKNEQIAKFLNTRHLKLQNGEKSPLLFSPQEYERRLANLR